MATAIVTKLLEQFKGSVQDVLIAYNAGPGAVSKFHETGALPDETRKYLARAGMPAGGTAPSNLTAPPTGMTFAALQSPQFDPGMLEKELNANVKVINEENQLRKAQDALKIKEADSNQRAINDIQLKGDKFHEDQAQRIVALRKQYAGRAADFTPDPEIQTRLLGGADPQVGVLNARAQQQQTLNAIKKEELTAQRELLEGELALEKVPAKQLEIKNRIAQLDSQLATSIESQAVLQQKLNQNAAQYTEELQRQRRTILEMEDTIGQRTARGQISQLQVQRLTGPAGAGKASTEVQEAAITAQFAEESEKRWQAQADSAQKGSQAWIEAEDKIAEAAASATEKLTENLRKVAEESKKNAKEVEHAFAGAFDSVGGEIKSMVNTDIKDLITGWPQATQQIQYFQTTAANGLPIVGERVRSIGPAMEQLIKLETKAAQSAVDLVLKLGEMAATKGLGALLGVATGAGTEAGTSIGGVLGAKITSLIPGLGSAATTTTPIVTAITGQTSILTGALTTLNAQQITSTAAIVSAIETAGVAGAVIPKPFGFAAGGIVSAQGGWIVPGVRGGQLAMVHQDEMVLPAHISKGIQAALGSGGERADVNDPYGGGGVSGDTHFHIHAHDTQTGAAFLMKHASTIARAARTGASRNAVTMRGFAG